MPRERERTTSRGKWTVESLLEAVRLKNEGVSIREAARRTGVPERTIRRRLKSNNFVKTRCGLHSYLGVEAESKLVAHIQKLQVCGFSPTPLIVRKLAYDLSCGMLLYALFLYEASVPHPMRHLTLHIKNDVQKLHFEK